jgi:hypothetical protein
MLNIDELSNEFDRMLFSLTKEDLLEWVLSYENRKKEYAEWYLEQYKERCKDYSYTDDYGQTIITETQFNQIPNPPHE